MIKLLSSELSVLSSYLREIRDVSIQNDPLRFRRNIERIGEFASIEISKTLTYTSENITTPLGICEAPVIADQIVVASIMRAGLPMHQGVLNVFDRAENAFFSAYRKHDDIGGFDIVVEYEACPDLSGKIVILVDPMLATGRTIKKIIPRLYNNGMPKQLHVVSAIGSAMGVESLEKEFGESITIWVAAVDQELSAEQYIVPGLGDAGDLAFGKKNRC